MTDYWSKEAILDRASKASQILQNYLDMACTEFCWHDSLYLFGINVTTQKDKETVLDKLILIPGVKYRHDDNSLWFHIPSYKDHLTHAYILKLNGKFI